MPQWKNPPPYQPNLGNPYLFKGAGGGGGNSGVVYGAGGNSGIVIGGGGGGGYSTYYDMLGSWHHVPTRSQTEPVIAMKVAWIKLDPLLKKLRFSGIVYGLPYDAFSKFLCSCGPGYDYGHDRPSANSSCGFYALKPQPGLWQQFMCCMTGTWLLTVRLSGRVLGGYHGYRGEYQHVIQARPLRQEDRHSPIMGPEYKQQFNNMLLANADGSGTLGFDSDIHYSREELSAMMSVPFESATPDLGKSYQQL